MGKYTKNKTRPKRIRLGKKETLRNISDKIKKQISQTKEKGLKASFINRVLKRASDFIGCFAQDELEYLEILKYPVYLIVNIDDHDKPGSHWLAIHLDRKRIEIFDSLGFREKYWSSYAGNIVKFIRKHSYKRRVIISPLLQPLSSTFCGLYCIYFVLVRSYQTFSHILSRFSKNTALNDTYVINYLLHL